MKLSKNILVLILLISNSYVYCDKTKAEILKVITSAHTRVFSKDNLYKEKLTDIGTWNQAIDAVSVFVKSNIKSDKDLLKALNSITDLNQQLIQNINITYSSFFYKIGCIAGTKTARTKNYVQFNDAAKKFKQVQDDLKNLKLYLSSKKDAAEVLSTLALTLELTATKAANDISKEVGTRKSKACA